MVRLFALMLALAIAGAAHAGSTRYSDGYANWFYTCANHEVMHILILHPDQSITELALSPAQTMRTFVRRGDVVATECDAWPVPLQNMFRYIVTAP